MPHSGERRPSLERRIWRASSAQGRHFQTTAALGVWPFSSTSIQMPGSSSTRRGGLAGHAHFHADAAHALAHPGDHRSRCEVAAATDRAAQVTPDRGGARLDKGVGSCLFAEPMHFRFRYFSGGAVLSPTAFRVGVPVVASPSPFAATGSGARQRLASDGDNVEVVVRNWAAEGGPPSAALLTPSWTTTRLKCIVVRCRNDEAPRAGHPK